jgi:D-sedoheptulose 7-phosphate isomerase
MHWKSKRPITNLKISGLIERYSVLEICQKEIITCCEWIRKSFDNGGKLLVMGNGGSSADSEHLVGELMKGFILKRPIDGEIKKRLDAVDPSMPAKLQGALPAMSLVTGHSIISAFANDIDPDFIYAQQILGIAGPHDVIIGITTSGNSRNVLWGIKVAKAMGIKTVVLTGEDGGKSNQLADLLIKAPAKETFKIQEYHLPIYHALCIELEAAFFDH